MTSGGDYSGEVVIPSSVTYNDKTYSVTSIGTQAFADCIGLTSVIIPGSVTNIGSWAFGHCSGLVSATIGSGVTSIGSFAFSGCEALTSVTLESNAIVSNGNRSMASIFGYQVETYIIGDGVTTIGESAFEGCSGLTSVTIGNSVTSIGEYAFKSCRVLTSVTIGNNVTSIGYGAFSGCSGLTSVTIGNSVTSIGYYAFYGCSSLQYNEYDEAFYLGNDENPYVVLVNAKSTDITACDINAKCKVICNEAFKSCSSLTSITIPECVTNIGAGAFHFCRSLTEVYCFAKEVPATDTDEFYGSPIASATLYVPAGSVGAYKATEPWSSFGTIVGLTVGIKDIEHSPLNNQRVDWFDLNGRKTTNPQNGINIIRYPDGTIRKVLRKCSGGTD